MTNVLRLPVLFPLVVLLAAGFDKQLYAEIGQPHLHPSHISCANCHLDGANTTSSNASALVASQEQLCAPCHPDSLRLSHPSGFVAPPTQKISSDYPLDRKGYITCSTCHNIHGTSPGKLRGLESGKNMCTACHEQTFFDLMPDNGISLIQRGHLGKTATNNWQNPDQYSIQCMECHSDKGDKNEGEDPIVLASNQILRHGPMNHSIGRDYMLATVYGGYRAADKLPQKIVLPNGQTSCVSCHQGYSKTHGQLVTTMARSALCLECHDL